MPGSTVAPKEKYTGDAGSKAAVSSAREKLWQHEMFQIGSSFSHGGYSCCGEGVVVVAFEEGAALLSESRAPSHPAVRDLSKAQPLAKDCVERMVFPSLLHCVTAFEGPLTTRRPDSIAQQKSVTRERWTRGMCMHARPEKLPPTTNNQ